MESGWTVSRVAITGSTGLIGEALIASLTADGHTVQRITRRAEVAGPNDIVWNLDAGILAPEPLEGVDTVVHLAGAPIRTGWWTASTKRAILDSRRIGTRLVATTLAGLSHPPSVLVSGSAVGFYGDAGDRILTESSPAGEDFMARVCAAWEKAAAPARDAGIRVVHSRTGVTLAKEGPLIEKVELPFRMGVGGKVGSGRQYVPWISLDDLVRGLRFLIDHDLDGPVNLTAPEAVTNHELTKALGEVLNRPTVFRIPALAVRALYGTIGETLATVSQRVVPQRLLDAGFVFTHTDVRAALRAALVPAGAD